MINEWNYLIIILFHTGKKYFYYPIMLFGNVVINKIPSRHIRKLYAQLLGARIGNSFF